MGELLNRIEFQLFINKNDIAETYKSNTMYFFGCL